MTDPVLAPLHLLTAAEAAAVLRVDETDVLMLDLLPSIDLYIQNATGRDWTLDLPINEIAKGAARMLLVQWYENPAMIASGYASLDHGFSAALTQLEASAIGLESDGVPDEPMAISKSMPSDGASEIYTGVKPVLIFNHELDADAVDTVTLTDSNDVAIPAPVTLDVTNRILTINPSTALSATTRYLIHLTATPDVYGQTLTTDRSFTTA